MIGHRDVGLCSALRAEMPMWRVSSRIYVIRIYLAWKPLCSKSHTHTWRI